MDEVSFEVHADRRHFDWTHVCRDGSRPTVTLPSDTGAIAILRSDPLTVRPGFGCTACGTHGFIHDGRWFDA